MIALDSVIEGREGGDLDEAQLAWLDGLLRSEPGAAGAGAAAPPAGGDGIFTDGPDIRCRGKRGPSRPRDRRCIRRCARCCAATCIAACRRCGRGCRCRCARAQPSRRGCTWDGGASRQRRTSRRPISCITGTAAIWPPIRLRSEPRRRHNDRQAAGRQQHGNQHGRYAGLGSSRCRFFHWAAGAADRIFLAVG